MKYRAEIDGLRALAVLPVILFHAGFEWFSGGFIGVDVFFVISGYLITTIIISEMAEGKFSIVNFYERRARRILPALFFVMAACLPFAWMWMLPSQLKDFSESLVAVSTFSSNILFWLETGYFSESSEAKPLLHTWSLAVEEQYYILFPIFLMLTWRLGIKWVSILLSIVFFISLGIAQWGAYNSPSATFFLLSTRGWELLVGVFAAFYLKYNTYLKAHFLNQALSLLGFGMITYSIIAFDKTTPFPSLYALIPTIGTGLLILCAVPKTFVHRLLSLKFIVGIGLISYSAYLWHQPLFAFARIFFNEVSLYIFITLILITFLAAYLTWKYIESPFRSKQSISRNNIFIGSFVLAILFIAIGLTGHLKQGFESRININGSDKIEAIVKELDFSGYPSHRLVKQTKTNYYSVGNTSENNPAIVIIGDSHAHQYWYGIANYIEKRPDIFKTKNVYLKNHSLIDLSADAVQIPHNTEKVVLSYFWSLHLNNPNVNTFIRCCGDGPGGVVGKEFLKLDNSELEGRYINLEAFIKNLIKLEIEVILVLDNPFGEELDARSLLEVKRGLTTSIHLKEKSLIELQTSDALARRNPTADRLMSMGDRLNIELIDPFDFLCNVEFCPKFNKDKGYFIYKDYDHLSLPAIKNEGNFINSIFE
jgi:peptidoglycan/LPS O-acetylase OafA/YrhL